MAWQSGLIGTTQWQTHIMLKFTEHIGTHLSSDRSNWTSYKITKSNQGQIGPKSPHNHPPNENYVPGILSKGKMRITLTHNNNNMSHKSKARQEKSWDYLTQQL